MGTMYGAWGKLPECPWKGSSAQPLAKKRSVSRGKEARSHGVQQELCRTKPAGECTGSWILLRGSNLRHSSGVRILLLKIHLLTGQHVEREPVLAWNTQPCNAFLPSQRLDPSDSASRCPSWSTGDILTFLKPSSKWLYEAWRLLLIAHFWKSTKYRNCPLCLTNTWVKQTFCGQLWNTSTITKYS